MSARQRAGRSEAQAEPGDGDLILSPRPLLASLVAIEVAHPPIGAAAERHKRLYVSLARRLARQVLTDGC